MFLGCLLEIRAINGKVKPDEIKPNPTIALVPPRAATAVPPSIRKTPKVHTTGEVIVDVSDFLLIFSIEAKGINVLFIEMVLSSIIENLPKKLLPSVVTTFILLFSTKKSVLSESFFCNRIPFS